MSRLICDRAKDCPAFNAYMGLRGLVGGKSIDVIEYAGAGYTCHALNSERKKLNLTSKKPSCARLQELSALTELARSR